MTSLWSFGISLSIDSSRRSESLLSPHRFLSWVFINFSLENDRSTEAVVTGIVCQTREKLIRSHIITYHISYSLLGTLAQLSHCWMEGAPYGAFPPADALRPSTPQPSSEGVV